MAWYLCIADGDERWSSEDFNLRLGARGGRYHRSYLLPLGLYSPLADRSSLNQSACWRRPVFHKQSSAGHLKNHGPYCKGKNCSEGRPRNLGQSPSGKQKQNKININGIIKVSRGRGAGSGAAGEKLWEGLSPRRAFPHFQSTFQRDLRHRCLHFSENAGINYLKQRLLWEEREN